MERGRKGDLKWRKRWFRGKKTGEYILLGNEMEGEVVKETTQRGVMIYSYGISSQGQAGGST